MRKSHDKRFRIRDCMGIAGVWVIFVILCLFFVVGDAWGDCPGWGHVSDGQGGYFYTGTIDHPYPNLLLPPNAPSMWEDFPYVYTLGPYGPSCVNEYAAAWITLGIYGWTVENPGEICSPSQYAYEY